MAKSGLKHIDVGPELTKTEWESEESHELLHGNSFPGSPVERQLFYRDDEHKWYIYNGSAWAWLGGGGGMAVHGNEYHDPDFEQAGVAASLVETHRTAATHTQPQPPAAHKTSHQDGGADEINVGGLNGELADLQKVKDHTHQSAGSGVGGKLDHGLALNGLSDDDHPQYIKHSLATAVSDFLVASGAGVFVKKTLAEVKTILNWAADIATHAALTTGVHGAGASTVASIANIATHAALTATHGVAGTIAGLADIVSYIATHAGLTSGVHGVGASTVESASGSQAKVDTHANLTTAHSAVSAATASRMVVRDASGRAAFAAPNASGDALIKGTAITDTEHGSRGSGLHTDSHTQNTDKVIKDADADTQIQMEESADEDKIRMDVKGVEAFLLDDAGILTLVKQSAARAYLGTNQSIPTGTLTLLNLDTENFDIQSEFNTGTYRYVASKAGLYLVVGAVTYTDLTDQKACFATIMKNGAEYLAISKHQSGAAGQYLAPAVVDILFLAVSDYLQLAAWHNLGANANVLAGTARTFLGVFKLA